MARPAEAEASQVRLILDAGAVIAWSRADLRARSVIDVANRHHVDVIVPAVVLAETVRGTRRDAVVNLVLKTVDDFPPATESTARLAGSLLGVAKSANTLDALVVAAAIEAGGGVILTGDADDLRRLAAGHPEVRVASL